MKLSDVERFSLETEVHSSGGMSVTLFVLADKKLDAGNQRQLDVVNVVSDGKDEEEATAKGVDFSLEVLESLKSRADIVKVGVRELGKAEPNAKEFTAKVQVGLFDKQEEGADLIVKKGFGFGKDKDMKRAQKKAIASALRLMGEE